MLKPTHELYASRTHQMKEKKTLGNAFVVENCNY